MVPEEIVLIDSSFLHAALYLSLYATPMGARFQSAPVNVMDGLQCSVGRFRQLLCHSAFRWPKPSGLCRRCVGRPRLSLSAHLLLTLFGESDVEKDRRALDLAAGFRHSHNNCRT
jgi:hypothetical protein